MRLWAAQTAPTAQRLHFTLFNLRCQQNLRSKFSILPIFFTIIFLSPPVFPPCRFFIKAETDLCGIRPRFRVFPANYKRRTAAPSFLRSLPATYGVKTHIRPIAGAEHKTKNRRAAMDSPSIFCHFIAAPHFSLQRFFRMQRMD